MGFFDILKKNNSVNNTELAYDLFSTLSMAEIIHPNNIKRVREIQNECTDAGNNYPDRNKILLKVIEIAGQETNSDNLYIMAKAYSWLPVKYNKEAIKYWNLYIDNGISNYAMDNYVGINHPEQYRKFIHLSSICLDLGDKYLIDYDYDNAMMSFNKMMEYDNLSRMPYGRQLPYLRIADTYRRMNKLDDAINTLKNAKFPEDVLEKDGTGYDYNVEYWKEQYYDVINRFLDDYIKKKEKGYVYRPRGHKE